MRPTTTLAAWHDYLPGLWNQLVMPEGADKDLLIDTIEEISSEFGTVYHNPFAVQYQVNTLCKRFKWGMDRDWSVLHKEYDALANYDRKETYTDREAASGSTSSSTSAESETLTNVVGDASDTSSVMAFDAQEFQDRGKNIGHNETTNTDNTTSSANGSSSSESSRTLEHTASISGNIGVTTSQQMLEAERQIASSAEFYGTWAWMFVHALCVCIY